ERRDGLDEAIHRRSYDTRSDLADAGLPVRDTGGHRRTDAVVDDLADVDPAGRPRKVEVRQRERRIACDGNFVHLARVSDRLGDRASDELDQRRGRGEREAAEAGRLADRAVAEIG